MVAKYSVCAICNLEIKEAILRVGEKKTSIFASSSVTSSLDSQVDAQQIKRVFVEKYELRKYCL